MALSKFKTIMNKKMDRTTQRIFFWIIWLTFLFFTIGIVISRVPESLPHPEYIPTISSGLIASMSVLMAFAFFSITNLQSHITDNYQKRRSIAYSMVYMFILFFVLVFGVVSGYMYILVDVNLKMAFICFIGVFILMCGLIFDMFMLLLDTAVKGIDRSQR